MAEWRPDMGRNDRTGSACAVYHVARPDSTPRVRVARGWWTMKPPPFQFSLQALFTLREADKREVDLRIRKLEGKLRRAKANRERRLKKVRELGQQIQERTENLMAPAGARLRGVDVRERARQLSELRAEREHQEARARRKLEVVRLFQGQLRAQEERRNELQAEIDELERLRQEELRKYRRELARIEERERDEDQIQRQNRPDDP